MMWQYVQCTMLQQEFKETFVTIIVEQKNTASTFNHFGLADSGQTGETPQSNEQDDARMCRMRRNGELLMPRVITLLHPSRLQSFLLLPRSSEMCACSPVAV